MTLSRIVWIVLLLLPGAALVALGLYMYGDDDAELSHVYGGFAIAIGILVLLAGILLALPRKTRLTPRRG